MVFDKAGGVGAAGGSPFSLSEAGLEEYVPKSELELLAMYDWPESGGDVINEVSWDLVEDRFGVTHPWELGEGEVLEDVQRDQVYYVERFMRNSSDLRLLSDADVVGMVRGWAEEYGVSMPDVFRLDLMEGAAEGEMIHGGYREGVRGHPAMITVGVHAPREWLGVLVAHEFAHHVVTERFGGLFGHEAHGPEFVRTYLDLLDSHDLMPETERWMNTFDVRVG